MLHALLDALSLAFGMAAREILWALILGFLLSAEVCKAKMTRLMPDDSLRSLATATGLGEASSSCSYAAVGLPLHLPQGRELYGGHGLPIRSSSCSRRYWSSGSSRPAARRCSGRWTSETTTGFNACSIPPWGI